MKDTAQEHYSLINQASKYFSEVFEAIGATSLYAQNLYFLFCIGHEGFLKLFHTWVHVTVTLLICTVTK